MDETFAPNYRQQKLSPKLRNNLEDTENQESSLYCAKCGSRIESLIDAQRAEVNGNLHFFCSQECSGRFIESQVDLQDMLADILGNIMQKRRKQLDAGHF